MEVPAGMGEETPEDLTTQLIRSLGLDPSNVAGFTLEARVGTQPNLTVMYEAWQPDHEAFLRTFQNYALVPVQPGERLVPIPHWRLS